MFKVNFKLLKGNMRGVFYCSLLYISRISYDEASKKMNLDLFWRYSEEEAIKHDKFVGVGEGSGDRLRSPASPGQSPSRGSRGQNPSPLSSGGFEELQTFI